MYVLSFLNDFMLYEFWSTFLSNHYLISYLNPCLKKMFHKMVNKRAFIVSHHCIGCIGWLRKPRRSFKYFPVVKQSVGAAGGGERKRETLKDRDYWVFIVPCSIFNPCGAGVSRYLSLAGWGGAFRLAPCLTSEPIGGARREDGLRDNGGGDRRFEADTTRTSLERKNFMTVSVTCRFTQSS